MKHLLNDLSEQEKNSIREQHTGGMKVMTESFSKLLNSKLGDVKPIVNEQSTPTSLKTGADQQLVNKVFADIKSAMSGPGTDEDKLLSALYKMAPNTSGAGWDANVAQKRKDYEYLLQLLRKEGFEDLMSWVSGDIAPHHATNPDAISKALGVDKSYENDKKIGDAVRKLDDLLSGRTNYL